MKKNYLPLLLASLPLTLISCGGTTNSAVIPSGGSSVDAATVASPKLQAALTAVSQQAASAVKLDHFDLNASVEANVPMTSMNSAGSFGISTQAITGHAALNNVSYFVGITGLDAKDLNEVKGQMNFNADVDLGYNYGPTAVSFKQDGISASAYIVNQNSYIDTSSAGLAAAVKQIQAFRPSFNLPLGKFLMGENIFKGDVAPLLDDTAYQSSIATAAKGINQFVSQYSSYFSAYSYGDGSYCLAIDLNKDQLVTLFQNAFSSMSTTSVKAMTNPLSGIPTSMMASNLLAGLSVNSFKAGLTFDEKGFKNFAYDIDVAVNLTLGDITSIYPQYAEVLTAEQKALPEKLNFKSSLGLSYLSGSDVKLSLPSSFEGYSKYTADSSDNGSVTPGSLPNA